MSPKPEDLADFFRTHKIVSCIARIHHMASCADVECIGRAFRHAVRFCMIRLTQTIAGHAMQARAAAPTGNSNRRNTLPPSLFELRASSFGGRYSALRAERAI
jgi:hypothetical protein